MDGVDDGLVDGLEGYPGGIIRPGDFAVEFLAESLEGVEGELALVHRRIAHHDLPADKLHAFGSRGRHARILKVRRGGDNVAAAERRIVAVNEVYVDGVDNLAHRDFNHIVHDKEVAGRGQLVAIGNPLGLNRAGVHVPGVGLNDESVGITDRRIVVIYVNELDGDFLGLALSDELDLRILVIHELPAVVVVVDEAYDGVLIVRGVGAAAILGAELVNEVLGFKGDVANILPEVIQRNSSDVIAGLVEIDESPVVLRPGRDAIDKDVYQSVDFISGGRFGRAHDLAGDGGIASDFPSFRLGAPGQHERPFGVVGISMPVLDLLIVSLKNEVVIRLDGADFIRVVYNNNAVVLIQMETLVGVLGIFVDAVEVYGELIQLILGRVTGLVGRRLGLLSLVNRGGDRSAHFAGGDGVIQSRTGVRLRHGVGVVNVYGVISRDIDSDVVTVFASGNGLKLAVLAAYHDGAAAFPHGVGDNDVLGVDLAVVGDGDSVLKRIANSGHTLAAGNVNGLVYVELGHRLGLSGLALDGEGDGRSAAADVLPVVIGVDVQQLAGLALGAESVGVISDARSNYDRTSPLISIPRFIEGVAAFNNIKIVVLVVGYAVDSNAHAADVRIGRRLRMGLRIRLNRRLRLSSFAEVDFKYFLQICDTNIQIIAV